MAPAWPSSLVALQHRNFRLLWAGLLVSFSGSLMQNAALLWHVSLLVSDDNKAMALGFVGLARVGPIILFSMISGVVADALDRRRVMLITQSLAALVALALAALAAGGMTAVWPVYALAAVGASVSAFDLPARQALIPALVPRHHLPNAITLNTFMFQTAAVLGPALAGFVIAWKGVAFAYLFNAASFACVIGALLAMDRNIREPVPRDAAGGNDVSLRAAMEGLRFVFRSPMMRSTMLLDFFATFFASATALLPIFAQDVLQIGPRGYGWLSAAPAVGSLLTSVALVPLVERIQRRGVAIVWAVIGHGIATIVFGVSRSFALTFACLALIGSTDTVSTVIRNVIRQLETPDHLRGRMTGISMIFFQGGPQLGEVEAGATAHWFGVTFSVVSGGIGCILATAWIAKTTPALLRYRTTADPAAAVS